MAVKNHWQLSCMALSFKRSLTNLLFSFEKSLTIVLSDFKLVKNHWQISCMAVRAHWQMSIMAVRQKVDKIIGNTWQNYCTPYANFQKTENPYGTSKVWTNDPWFTRPTLCQVRITSVRNLAQKQNSGH